MVNIASSTFGCKAGDTACYCADPRFSYGIRDCANEACGDSSTAQNVIAAGNAYCASEFDLLCQCDVRADCV
ncbi:hypothetical protein K491DRAFT_692468 [Lophiostoma macrostomum CBS 122681]|uniref:CFEM domain-containing protein n=1 Tax=Lophiostoma macrostomum CBS 122681 TaxID=1314788 RepID=A0A6A6T9N5_9PLEO|nr:hypothetical protein K491DRAFT_692468 [Lophiostoma macrostomum CBS 122681]